MKNSLHLQHLLKLQVVVYHLADPTGQCQQVDLSPLSHLSLPSHLQFCISPWSMHHSIFVSFSPLHHIFVLEVVPMLFTSLSTHHYASSSKGFIANGIIVGKGGNVAKQEARSKQEQGQACSFITL